MKNEEIRDYAKRMGLTAMIADGRVMIQNGDDTEATLTIDQAANHLEIDAELFHQIDNRTVGIHGIDA